MSKNRFISFFGLIVFAISFQVEVRAQSLVKAVSNLKIEKITRLEGLGMAAEAKLKAAGVDQLKKVTYTDGRVVYKLETSSGAMVRSFEMGSPTAREAMKEFAPSKIAQYFKELKATGGKITKEKLIHFPVEAFTFFVAIGALTAKDVVLNYENNPVVTEQFLQGQADPVGQVGFAAFMLVNGYTAEPLMAISGSSRTRAFIPYLGMSLGMMASNIIHEVGHFPGLMSCAASLGKNTKVCDEAYQAWVKYSFAEKGHEWAPALMGMVGSTLIAGATESVTKAAAFQAAKVIGIDIALAFTGAGVFVTGARWAYRIGQNVAFIYLDGLLRSPLTFFWKDKVQVRPHLEKMSLELRDIALTKNKSGWLALNEAEKTPTLDLNCMDAVGAYLENCTEVQSVTAPLNFNEKVQDYVSTMTKWRQANLEPVLTAEANWSQYLANLSSQYLVSKSFYMDFVTHIWQKKYKKSEGYTYAIDREMPLFGIKPDGLSEDNKIDYIIDPAAIEQRQLETVSKIVEQINQIKIQVLSELSDKEKVIFSELFKKLESKNPTQIGESFWAIRLLIKKETTMAPQMMLSEKLHQILSSIFEAAGDPNPKTIKGQGYLKLLSSGMTKEIYQKNPFTGVIINRAISDDVIEELVFRMISGPEAENLSESDRQKYVLIGRNMNGFAADFYPPKLINENVFRTQKIYSKESYPLSFLNSIFNLRLLFPTDNTKETPLPKRTMLSYLSDDGIRLSAIGDEAGHKIGAWWEKNAETEYIRAWTDYESKYEKIVQDFHKILMQKDGVQTRAGLIKERNQILAYNPLATLRQEFQLLQFLYASLRSCSSQCSAETIEKFQSMSTRVFNYDLLNTIEAKSEAEQNIKALSEILVGFEEKFKLLKSAAVTESARGRTYLISRFSNQEIQALTDKAKELIKKESDGLELLEKSQKEIAQTILGGFTALFEDLSTYAKIINGASYIENHSTGQVVKKRCLQSQNNPMARLASLNCKD